MTRYLIGGAAIYLEDLVAVSRGESGYQMIWLYLHLKDLPKPVSVHVYKDDVPLLLDAWDTARKDKERE